MIVVRNWENESRFPTATDFRVTKDGEHNRVVEVLGDGGKVIAAFSSWSSVLRGEEPVQTTKAFDAFVEARTRATLLGSTDTGGGSA